MEDEMVRKDEELAAKDREIASLKAVLVSPDNKRRLIMALLLLNSQIIEESLLTISVYRARKLKCTRINGPV